MLLPDLNKGISKDSCDSNPFFSFLFFHCSYLILLRISVCTCVCRQEREGKRSEYTLKIKSCSWDNSVLMPGT